MGQKEEEVVKEKRLGSKRCNEHKDKTAKELRDVDEGVGNH